MPEYSPINHAQLEMAEPSSGKYIYDSEGAPVFDMGEFTTVKATWMYPVRCGHLAELNVLIPVTDIHQPLTEEIFRLELTPEINEAFYRVVESDACVVECKKCKPVEPIHFDNDYSTANWKPLRVAVNA